MSRDVHHPLFARFVAFVAARAAGGEDDELRRELLAGLSGRVIEIGSGSGPNFPHYPDAVTEIVAVEPEDYLRGKAEQAARESDRPIRVVDALADDLPFEDGAFDAVVVALVLCSVPSQAAALAELRRVLRPGGELRFYEHVIARQPRYAALQRASARVLPRLTGGCRADLDTGAAIEEAGFEIVRCRRFVSHASLLEVPVAPRILGAARRA
jgi:ubiquinone/menaquinone biosynthesis C-methylase UbiE